MRQELIPLPKGQRPYTVYEWETATAWRVLLKFKDGSEIDVEWDMVTDMCRRWDDGKEIGDPTLN